MPTLLLWGMDDAFQHVEYAERYARELPETNLLQVPGRHIPQEDSPAPVAAALTQFFAPAR